MLRSIKTNWAEPADPHELATPFPAPERIYPGLDEIDPETFPDFLDEIGLTGMGGSGFPTSEKVRRATDVHTLVINGIECEPGVSIDEAVLLNDCLWVAAGANALAKAISADHVVLAVRDHPGFHHQLQERYNEFRIVPFPDTYPAGAETLILKKLTGKMQPPGTRPYQVGYLVQNVATLRAIGRAIIDGIPVVERPLALAMPSIRFYKNIIAPVGLEIRELLNLYQLPYDPTIHLIIDSGLMMGEQVDKADTIEKTTLSILILNRDEAWRDIRPCTRCGACNTACPLGLHPFALTERIRKEKTEGTAYRAQITECFLCGVCSAVCPSDIPLVQLLKKGKQCQ